jgi:DNA-3-methyladenine glycosylase I
MRALVVGPDRKARCSWAGAAPEYVRYHDEEWGQPTDDDVRLFEKVCLEGFQSGLSWLTILRKRDAFRRAFAGFDFERVARFGARDVTRLLADAGIVRHRGKIESTVNNARRACELRDERGSLAAYFWSFEPDPRARPRRLTWATLRRMTTTPESVALSKDLRKRGWTFVGPTTGYAFMQAVGIVNDHLDGCAFRARAERARRAFDRPVPAARRVADRCRRTAGRTDSGEHDA